MPATYKASLLALVFSLVSACAPATGEGGSADSGDEGSNEGASDGEGTVEVEEYMDVKLDTLGDPSTLFDGDISAVLNGRVWTITARHGADAVLTLVYNLDNPNGGSCSNGTSIEYTDANDTYSTLWGIAVSCLITLDDDTPGELSGSFNGSMTNEEETQSFLLGMSYFRVAIDD